MYSEKKKCAKCGRVRNVSCFHRDRRSKDGLHCWCKSCTTINKNERREREIHERDKFLDELNEDPEFRDLVISLGL